MSLEHGQLDQLDGSSQETAEINEVIIIQDEDSEVIIIRE